MKKEIYNYRRDGKKVYIKQPTYEELEFVANLWADKETMKDIGGIFRFPEEKWRMFYKKMVDPTDGKNFYCLVYTIEGKAIGEVSFHGYDSITKIARFNVKIKSQYRNNGYGEEAVRLLLEYYFLEFGGEVIMDNIPTEAGLHLFKKIGFQEVGSSRDEITVKITKNEFLNNNKGKSKNASILIYDGINLSSYSTIENIMDIANRLHEYDIFNINVVSFKNKIETINKLTLFNEENLQGEATDILIIPDGNYIKEELDDSEKIQYIIRSFRESEYVCASGEGIKFLMNSNSLNGINVPNISLKNLNEEILNSNFYTDSNYVDNGKIMLSANMMGEVELALSLVDKVGGRRLAHKVANVIGVEWR